MASGTDLIAVCRLSGWGADLSFPGTDVTQAVFQGADLAEPLPFSRLGEPADGAHLDLVQARQLGGVDTQERALDAPLTELTTMF